MRIAVLGTGIPGRSVAARLAELGHDVAVGTRDPAATVAREEYAAWAASAPEVTLATFRDAAAASEVVFLMTGGGVALDALDLAGAENLAGKVLVDVTNPLDHSGGFPPTLFVKDDDSLGERVQRAHPQARVVKTLNTMTASVMVRPADLPEPTTVFVSGDDDAAKVAVTRLLEAFGHTDVVDLGDIATARGAEMYLPLWLRVMGGLGTASFNIKVVR